MIYEMIYDMIDIWYDIWYHMIHNMIYDMIYDMVCHLARQKNWPFRALAPNNIGPPRVPKMFGPYRAPKKCTISRARAKKVWIHFVPKKLGPHRAPKKNTISRAHANCWRKAFENVPKGATPYPFCAPFCATRAGKSTGPCHHPLSWWVDYFCLCLLHRFRPRFALAANPGGVLQQQNWFRPWGLDTPMRASAPLAINELCVCGFLLVLRVLHKIYKIRIPKLQILQKLQNMNYGTYT